MNRTNRLVSWLIAIGCVAVVVTAHAWLGERPSLIERHVSLGALGAVDEATNVRVSKVHVGQVWYLDDAVRARTESVFLVLDVTVETALHPRGSRHTVGIAADGRTFAPLEDADIPDQGFLQDSTIIFELSPDDVAGFRVGFYTREIAYARDPELIVDLGLDPATAAGLLADHRHDTVKSERHPQEAIP